MTVLGFTVVVLPHRFHAGQRRTKGRIAAVDVHRHGTTPTGTDHNIWLMQIKISLSDADASVKVVVGEGGIKDLVAVV